MSRSKPPTCRTTNWHDDNTALARRGSRAIRFAPETQWRAVPMGKRGRRPLFTGAAIQVCLIRKALFGWPLGPATGTVASLPDLAGPDWPVPDVSTPCRRQRTLTVHIPDRPGTGAPHPLIDSTGAKAEADGEWLARKHGPTTPRDWRKVHLGVDAETLEIRAIEITGSQVGDAPVLPDLPDQIPDDQPIGIVTADGAYDTRACHCAIAARGAAAVSPPRRDGKPRKEHTGRSARAQRCLAQLPSPRPGRPEALDRPSSRTSGRSKDAASRPRESVSWPATSNARSPRFRSGPQS
jgi:hypothetical protein